MVSPGHDTWSQGARISKQIVVILYIGVAAQGITHPRAAAPHLIYPAFNRKLQIGFWPLANEIAHHMRIRAVKGEDRVIHAKDVLIKKAA